MGLNLGTYPSHMEEPYNSLVFDFHSSLIFSYLFLYIIVLKAWGGLDDNIDQAQEQLLLRARCNRFFIIFRCHLINCFQA